MNKWRTKRLGDICEVIGGGTPSTSIKKYWNNDYYWVTPKDLGRLDGFEISKTERKISKLGLQNSSAKLLPVGSVILSSRAPIGYVFINTVEMATNQGCRSFICGDSIINKYLYHFLILNKEYLNKLGTGTTFKEVSGSVLKEIEIPLPPLPEQKRIVKTLDETFKKLEKAKGIAEKNLQNSKELFEHYLRDTFSNTKKGWEVKKLGEVAEYFNGLTYSPKNVSNDGIIVLRSSNVQNDELDFSDIVRVNCNVKEKVIVKEGDILMCSRNGSKRLVGKTATIKNLKESMTFGTFMMIIRGNNNTYLAWFFKSTEFRKQIAGGENTMINQITRYMLDDIVVSFPPQKELNMVVKKLDQLSEQTKKLESIYQKKLSAIEELKKSILNKALSGGL